MNLSDTDYQLLKLINEDKINLSNPLLGDGNAKRLMKNGYIYRVFVSDNWLYLTEKGIGTLYLEEERRKVVKNKVTIS